MPPFLKRLKWRPRLAPLVLVCGLPGVPRRSVSARETFSGSWVGIDRASVRRVVILLLGYVLNGYAVTLSGNSWGWMIIVVERLG